MKCKILIIMLLSMEFILCACSNKELSNIDKQSTYNTDITLKDMAYNNDNDINPDYNIMKNNDMHIKNSTKDNNTLSKNTEKHEHTKHVNADDITILSLTCGSDYNEILSTLGEPKEVLPIVSENIVALKGYFVLAKYDHIQLTIITDENYELNQYSTIAEIDVIDNNIETTKGIKVGSTVNDLIKAYNFNEGDYHKANKEGALNDARIKGLSKEHLTKYNYDGYYYITDNSKPIALVFLVEDNTVNRILIRHITAD